MMADNAFASKVMKQRSTPVMGPEEGLFSDDKLHAPLSPQHTLYLRIDVSPEFS